jgi:hypothetical protein
MHVTGCGYCDIKVKIELTDLNYFMITIEWWLMILITVIFMACDGYNDAEVPNVRKGFTVALDAVQRVHVQ